MNKLYAMLGSLIYLGLITAFSINGFTLIEKLCGFILLGLFIVLCAYSYLKNKELQQSINIMKSQIENLEQIAAQAADRRSTKCRSSSRTQRVLVCGSASALVSGSARPERECARDTGAIAPHDWKASLSHWLLLSVTHVATGP